jgi:hypothetical protein
MLFSINLVKVKQIWVAQILGIQAFRDTESMISTNGFVRKTAYKNWFLLAVF